MTDERRSQVYCDRLTWTNCVSVLLALRSLPAAARGDVRVLDPLTKGWRGRLAVGLLRAFGFAPREEPFYAGHLALPDGMPAQRAAADSTMRAALPASRALLADSPRLGRLNEAWGRDTVRLHLAKSLAMTFSGESALYGYALRVQVARALSLRDGVDGVLLVAKPPLFGLRTLQEMAPELRVRTYGATAAFVAAKAQIAWQIVRAAVRRIRAVRARGTHRQRLAQLRSMAAERPGLLVLQEDDLGLDRSYRSQPHWLLPDAPPPGFNTFALAHTATPRLHADANALASARVAAISDDDLLGLVAGGSGDAVSRRARRDARRCWLSGLVSASSAETMALAVLSRLFLVAAEMADACRELRVRTFMTAENYLVPADAMPMVGARLGVQTLSYQYANIAVLSPLMMTTADAMYTFAPSFHQHWMRDGIRPGAFVDVGYPFDAAFDMVKPRACATTRTLREAGATFVIAYFDENFFRATKYGLSTYEEHCDELRALLELVVRDPSIGLVTKVQFERNAASRLPGFESLVRRATGTGRFVELLKGVHRNTVFPAEAAMAADMTIGHAIGSTASLEAALAGSRSVMLNPYMMSDANHPKYAEADILLPSFDAALDAIAEYRVGRRPALGDWTPILDHFDQYRDGGAAQRLRAALDAQFAPEKSRA